MCDVGAVKTKRDAVLAMVKDYDLATASDDALPIDNMRSELASRIGHDGASAIDYYVVNTVRRNIKFVY